MDAGKVHINRLNEVLKHIEGHLDEELKLETLSEIACFSSFHFHRLFKACTGEPLNTYISRKRIEKIALVLLGNKPYNLTELAFRFGFNSLSSLSRTFKKFYGVSPTQFAKSKPEKYSKIGQVKSKDGKTAPNFETYICNMNESIEFIEDRAKVEVKNLPDLLVAYVTNIGDGNMMNHFDELLKWVIPNGLLKGPEARLIRIYHDSFKVTEHDKIRMSAGVILKEKITSPSNISWCKIKSNRYIIARFEIKPQEFGKAWDSLFIWMSEMGYQKSDSDPFEIYYNDFREHSEGKCLVDFCIPLS